MKGFGLCGVEPRDFDQSHVIHKCLHKMYCLTTHYQLVLNGSRNINCSLCWLICFSKFSHWSPAHEVLELVSEENKGFPTGMPLAGLHVELGQPLILSPPCY